MTGHHDVKFFWLSHDDVDKGWAAPRDWKPFSATPLPDGRVMVACRRFSNTHSDKGRTP